MSPLETELGCIQALDCIQGLDKKFSSCTYSHTWCHQCPVASCSHGNPLSGSRAWSDPWLAPSIWTGGENYQWITILGHQKLVHIIIVFCCRLLKWCFLIIDDTAGGRAAEGVTWECCLCLVTHNSRQVWVARPGPDLEIRLRNMIGHYQTPPSRHQTAWAVINPSLPVPGACLSPL